jgi:hypothetical protein
MRAAGESFSIPGVYRYPKPRAEGFARVRTDVAGFVGVAGPQHVGEAIAVDDWKSYVARFRRDAKGDPVPAPAGSMLEPAVRDYFANGGRRLWIVNVAAAIDPERTAELMNRMLGIGAPDAKSADPLGLKPHGLELLLRQDDVSVVALPDLDAVATVEEIDPPVDLPGDPCFRPCLVRNAGGAASLPGARRGVALGRIFSDDELLWAQRYLLSRLLRPRWRWFAILTPPPGLTPDRAVEWRERLGKGTGEEGDIAALYWPWLLAQDTPGAPVEQRSPVGAVAGIFAQVDIENGPHAAPANRRLMGAVGLQFDVGDADNTLAYDAGVNVLRAFPGGGIQVWGARTLRWRDRNSRGDPLSFVNARRCLSAIARTTEVIGGPIVFEPNTPLVRVKLHQLVTDYLLRVFAAGALMGETAEQGFFVRVESVQDSPEGQLICEIGVALAAPAEFIVFRIGRESGVSELDEAA